MPDSFAPAASPTQRRSTGWVHNHSATLVESLRVIDAVLILAGLWLAVTLREETWLPAHLHLGLLAVGAFTLAGGVWPLYRSWRIAPLRAELSRTAYCWIVAIALVSLGASVLAPIQVLDQLIFPLWALLTLVGLLGSRALLRIGLRLLRLSGSNFRIAAIVGANDTASKLSHVIQHTAWMGLRLHGYYDDRGLEHDRRTDLPVRGGLNDVIEGARCGNIDIVYICLPLRAENRIQGLIRALRDSTATVYFVPDFSALGLLRPHLESLGEVPLISLIETPHRGIDAAMKRLFDLAVGTLILALIALPMLFIAVAVRASSPGPAFFRQKRYGLNGQEFEMWKFRTMSVCEDGKTAFVQASRNDPRVTPLGAFLRRTSLDELPQFINVLQGRMSIVGPRPHPVRLNEQQRKLIDGYMLRHKVKPGITGLAQIRGYRGETDTPEKMEGRVRHDLEYIHNWSLKLDLQILFATVFKGFHGPNAF